MSYNIILYFVLYCITLLYDDIDIVYSCRNNNDHNNDNSNSNDS